MAPRKPKAKKEAKQVDFDAKPVAANVSVDRRETVTLLLSCEHFEARLRADALANWREKGPPTVLRKVQKLVRAKKGVVVIPDGAYEDELLAIQQKALTSGNGA